MARQNAPCRQLSDGQFSQNSPEKPDGHEQDVPLAVWIHDPPFWQRSSQVARVSQRSPVQSGMQVHLKGGGSEAKNKQVESLLSNYGSNGFDLTEQIWIANALVATIAGTAVALTAVSLV